MNHIGHSIASSALRVCLTLACLGLAACLPKTPTQIELVDARIQALEVSKNVYKADDLVSEQSAGQWLQYKSVDEHGEPSILTYKLIASDGFHHSIELVEEGYHGTSATYMELRYDPGRSTESLEVRRVLTQRGESSPRESSPEDLATKESYYRALAAQLFTPWVDAPIVGDTVVDAGTFEGCHKLEAVMTVSGLSLRADTWHHPVLPMHGMVKAVRSDGVEGHIELIDFGLDGAHSDVLRAVK